jgi:Zn-dependent protease
MVHKKSVLHFSPQEKKDLIISWLTLSLAFAALIAPVFLNIHDILFALPVALLAVGTGFIFHELAHREAAKHFGFHSEYRAWYPGLLIAIALALSPLHMIFAAPGATYFFGESITRKQNGVISIAGPTTNLIFGFLLTIIGALFMDTFLKSAFILAGQINFWFAFFNLIPIYPLDGAKVLEWKPSAWIVAIGASLILVFMPEIVFGLIGIRI